jgi:hypothetical protein
MGANIWFFGLDEPALSAHRAAHGPIDVEDLFEVEIPGMTELAPNFDAEEFAELLTAARTALAADPDWSEDGAQQGPTWWYLAHEGAGRAGGLVGIVAL